MIEGWIMDGLVLKKGREKNQSTWKASHDNDGEVEECNVKGWKKERRRN